MVAIQLCLFSIGGMQHLAMIALLTSLLDKVAIVWDILSYLSLYYWNMMSVAVSVFNIQNMLFGTSEQNEVNIVRFG